MKLVDIYDPIHSFIPVNELEIAILDSEPLQRLRNIRQLATVHYVFPGAEHSRFGHSLGVMHVATQMYDSLKQKGCLAKLGLNEDEEDELDRYRQLLRLAALVHDVGHPPFSHAGESGELLADGRSHESYTWDIVAERIDPILRDRPANTLGITSQEICDVLRGTEITQMGIVLGQMIAGELDADRIDYLMRDSYYTGVPYGRLDYHQLISTLTIIDMETVEPDETSDVPSRFALGVEEPGLHAAEGLLIGRYFMFSNVYFHKTRRVFDYHLSNVTRRILEETDGTKHYPTDISDYLKWDDSRIIAWMGRNPEDEDVDAICHRKHFRLVHETHEHAQKGDLERFKHKFEQLPTDLKEACWVDKAEKAMHSFEKVDFRVQPRDDSKPPQRIQELSSLIESLSPITRRRLYCARDKHKEVAHAWDKKGG